jgi:tol-pal system protein YbgF
MAMQRCILSHKTRLLLTAGALFIMLTPQAAQAQSNEIGPLLNRIKQLENQVQTMSRAIYRGDRDARDALANAGSAADAQAAANYEARMSAIEDQQRNITGQIEKLGFDVQQMKDQLTRMQADNEQRMQAIEQRANTAPVPSATTPAPSGTLGTVGGSAGSRGPAEVLYEEAFAAVRESQYGTAETKFKTFLTEFSSHPLAANARYWLGETYFVRGDYKSAAKSFAQGYQDFPKSGKAPDSLYKLGVSLAKLNKKDDACLSLRQFQKEFQSTGGPLQRKAQEEIKALGCP